MKTKSAAAKEYGLTVCPENNIAPSMLEHKAIAVKAFLAGHASRDLEVKELVDALEAIAKQTLAEEYENDEGEELDETTMAEAYEFVVLDARQALAKHRTALAKEVKG